jgi:aspartyl-tRNA(Asn)/glutamyl-tRNA(Gln) amidotransferase subunit A
MAINDRVTRAGLEAVSPDDVADAMRLADVEADAMRSLPPAYPSRCEGSGRAVTGSLLDSRLCSGGAEGEAMQHLSLAHIRAALEGGTLTPSALLIAVLDRIDAVDGRLNSFVAIDHVGAKVAADASAARWASGQALGPLDGIPVGIKDVIDVAGMPTRCHSRLTSGAPAEHDAAIVARLRAAGAIMLGKLATHEFAIGGPAFDLPFPPARNPWNVDHHPGGSSSGAGAAVASGLVPLAIGTDTAGSVRNPASACGVVGLKPGYGVLSCEGVVPLAWTLDHIGLLTRSAADMAIVSESLGIGGRAAGSRLRVGYVRHFHTRDMIATPDVAAALDRAAEALGATQIDLPALDDFALVNRVILQSEGFAFHATNFRARPDEFSASTRKALLPGAFLSAETLAIAYRQRTLLTAAVDAAFTAVDILLTASSMEPACRIDDPAEIARTYMLQARSPFNVTGHPALAMGAGLSPDGLPLSVQFAAPMRGEGTLIAVAAMWEAAMGGPMIAPID